MQNNVRPKIYWYRKRKFGQYYALIDLDDEKMMNREQFIKESLYT